MVAWAKKNNSKYLGLTDHGYLYGIPEFVRKCEKENIKPIIGCEFYYTSRYAGSKELGAEEKKHQYHLTILCKNNDGYKNLLRLASLATTKGMYYYPCIDDQMLRDHGDGLIVLSGCMSAYIPRLILEDKYDLALTKAKEYQEIFRDDYYIELMKHPVEEFSTNAKFREEQEEFVVLQDKILDGLYQISNELSIPAVCTNDAHYCDKDDFELHDIVYAMGMGRKVNDPDRNRFSANQFYMKTEEQMLELFPPEVVHRTVEIAEKCDVKFNEIYDGKLRMPHFPKVPAGMTEEEYLRQVAWDGLIERGKHETPGYKERLEHELGVINKLGWAGYFLILWDVMDFCAKSDIRTGDGRGSAVGSLVSYVLKITKVDPIEHGLLFERFLDESRASPPDIDCDFPKSKRHLVLEYVTSLYGEDNVVQIGTMTFMAVKGAIKKVATTFDVPFDKANLVTSYIPDGTESVKDALEITQVKKMYDSDPLIKKTIDIAIQVENMPQHVGVHAAGVVISPSPVVEHIPIRSVDGTLVTQWDMNDVEAFGGLKMDLLGLVTLDTIDYALAEISRNKNEEIDIDNIDLETPDIYELLSKADTSGVFQLESNLCRGYLKKMRPTMFNHVSDLLALIRPGTSKAPSPSGKGTMVDEYILRMHGRSPITYPHPLLKDVLNRSQGIILMQEDLMQATRVMAGFTGAEAYAFMRVVGKKEADKMPAQIEKFIKGCVANGVTKEDAERVSHLLETFAEYGFNRCLHGETVVYWVLENGERLEITVEELYNCWSSEKLYGKGEETPPLMLLSSVDGIVVPRKCVGVYKTGRKRLLKVETENGKSIIASKYHKFLTNKGWKRLKDISVGDYLNSTNLTNELMREDGAYYTYLDKVMSIKKYGTRETYDIEMEAPHHNFLANEIVVHNSHTVAYAHTSAKTAYLKALYTTEFMASLITHEEDKDKREMYLSEAFSKGIKLLPPSVNISSDKFVADGAAIRFSLIIKNVGKAAIEAISKEREANGPFKSFEDFIFRAYGEAVTKAVVISLARSGAFDEFGLTRKQMAESIETIVKAFNSYKGKIKRIQDRYDLMLGWDDVSKIETERKKLEEREVKANEDLKKAVHNSIYSIEDEYDKSELSQFEFELLGQYVLNHPLNEFRGHFNTLMVSTTPLALSNGLTEHIGKTVKFFGMVASAKKGKNRYGDFVDATMQDWDGSVTVKAFSKQATQYEKLLKKGNVVVVTGRVIHYESSNYSYIRVDKVEPAQKGLPEKVIMVFASDDISDKVRGLHKPEGEATVLLVTSNETILLDSVRLDADSTAQIRNFDDVHQVLTL